MKVVVFPAPEIITVEQVSDPICGAEDVIVQVAMCGICGTDLHIYRNAFPEDVYEHADQWHRIGSG